MAMRRASGNLHPWQQAIFWSDDSFNLQDVIDVVPGKHFHDRLDGLFAAFGVHAVMFPLLGRKRFQHRKIGFAKYAELLERFARVALVVVERHDPGVLIESLNRSAGSAEDEAHAESADDFSVRHVGDDFRDGPLPWRGPLAQFPGWLAFEQALDFFGRFRLQL